MKILCIKLERLTITSVTGNVTYSHLGNYGRWWMNEWTMVEDGEWMNEWVNKWNRKQGEWMGNRNRKTVTMEKGGETHSHMAEFSVSSQGAESV